MKLRDVAKGKRAVKAVPFRLANAPDPKPVPPGEEPALDDYTVLVGLRVLTGNEAAQALQSAEADARKRGVTQWLDTHPLCRLYEMAHTVAAACVDLEARDEPFFVSAQELLDSPLVGEDNIAYLYEQQRYWQDECSLRSKDLSVEQVLELLSKEAERPENTPSPSSHLRAATQPSFLRITANLWRTLLMASLASSSSGEPDTSKTPETPSNDSPTPEG